MWGRKIAMSMCVCSIFISFIHWFNIPLLIPVLFAKNTSSLAFLSFQKWRRRSFSSPRSDPPTSTARTSPSPEGTEDDTIPKGDSRTSSRLCCWTRGLFTNKLSYVFYTGWLFYLSHHWDLVNDQLYKKRLNGRLLHLNFGSAYVTNTYKTFVWYFNSSIPSWNHNPQFIT